MSYLGMSDNSSLNICSIIGVPAIGADPNRTWTRLGDGPGNEHQWLGSSLYQKIPSANVLLYDHLEPQERRLVVKAAVDPAHECTVERFTSAEAALAEFGVEDWADRFLTAIRYYRTARKARFYYLCRLSPLIYPW